MHKNHGFGVIEVIVAVVIIALLAVAGFMLTREANQTKTVDTHQQEDGHSHEGESEAHEEAEDLQTYSNAEHGYSFSYPNDWQVRELGEDKLRQEPQVVLVNAQGERRLALFDDALMGCEQAPTGNEETTTLNIGGSELAIAKNCNQSWGFFQLKPAASDTMITITPGDFLGSHDEETVRKVLASLKGLTVIK